MGGARQFDTVGTSMSASVHGQGMKVVDGDSLLSPRT